MSEETKDKEQQEKQYTTDIHVDKKTRIVNDTHGFEILRYTQIVPRERDGVKPEPYWEWKNDGYFGSIYQAITGSYHKKINETTATNLKELREHILSVEKEFEELFGFKVQIDDKKVAKTNKGKK